MTSKPKSKKTPVKGGWVQRDAATGRFIAVRGSEGVAKASEVSLSAVKAASAKHSAALKRLANR